MCAMFEIFGEQLHETISKYQTDLQKSKKMVVHFSRSKSSIWNERRLDPTWRFENQTVAIMTASYEFAYEIVKNKEHSLGNIGKTIFAELRQASLERFCLSKD